MSIANPRSGMEFGGATLRGTQYPDCHGRVLHIAGPTESKRGEGRLLPAKEEIR